MIQFDVHQDTFLRADVARAAADKLAGADVVLSNRTSADEALAVVRDGLSRAAGSLGNTPAYAIWLLGIAAAVMVASCFCVMARHFDGRAAAVPPAAKGATKNSKLVGAADPTRSLCSSRSGSARMQAGQSSISSSQASLAVVPRPRMSMTRMFTNRASSVKDITGSAKQPPAPPEGTQVGKQFSLQDGMPPSMYGRPEFAASSLRHKAFREEAGESKEGCCFTMPVDTLVEVVEEGSFSMKDIFSSLKLWVVVSRFGDGVRRVRLFRGPGNENLASSVGPPEDPGAGPDTLELRGMNGIRIGSLALMTSGSFVVRAQGHPQLLIEGSENDLKLEVRTRADSIKVATITCEEAWAGGPEQVEIHVLQGTDPVLIVTCALAILFLCGDGADGDESTGRPSLDKQ